MSVDRDSERKNDVTDHTQTEHLSNGQPDGDARRARLYRCEGVVIRRRDFGEADRLVTLLTDSYGKLRLLAKGTRRTKSRLAGQLEPYARTSILIARGRNLDIITQGQIVDPMRNLRQDERAISYAAHWAELADQLVVEHQENRPAYLALVRALTSLDHEREPRTTSRIAEWEFLAAAGVQPELFACTVCGARIEPGNNGWHIEAGGVLCPDCRAREPHATTVSTAALRVLRALGRGETERLHGLEISEELHAELEDMLITYMRSVAERDLHAFRILKRLEALPEAGSV